jgi:hypothetical protein
VLCVSTSTQGLRHRTARSHGNVSGVIPMTASTSALSISDHATGSCRRDCSDSNKQGMIRE